jgi:hypothetical protein
MVVCIRNTQTHSSNPEPALLVTNTRDNIYILYNILTQTTLTPDNANPNMGFVSRSQFHRELKYSS